MSTNIVSGVLRTIVTAAWAKWLARRLPRISTKVNSRRNNMNILFFTRFLYLRATIPNARAKRVRPCKIIGYRIADPTSHQVQPDYTTDSSLILIAGRLRSAISAFSLTFYREQPVILPVRLPCRTTSTSAALPHPANRGPDRQTESEKQQLNGQI